MIYNVLETKKESSPPNFWPRALTMGATLWASEDSRKFASYLPLGFIGIGFIDEWKTYASVEPIIIKGD